MAKTKVVRVKTWLWDKLQDGSLAKYGAEGEEMTYLAELLTGSTPVNPPKRGSAAPEEKKISSTGRAGKRFLEHSEAGHTGWMYEEDEPIKYTYFFNYVRDKSFQDTYGSLFRKNKNFDISEDDMALAQCFAKDYAEYKEATRPFRQRPESQEKKDQREEQERVLAELAAKNNATMDRIQSNIQKETTYEEVVDD